MEQLTGQIIEWNEAKGYGFVDDGRLRVFAHIRDFIERPHRPGPGDKVTYMLGTDRHGRVCAQSIYLPFPGVPLRAVHGLVLLCLLVTPAWAVWRLERPDVVWIALGWVIVVSAITYGFYLWDKRCAQSRSWRIPESFLHFYELLGGWPGGFLAQRRLRHKSAKGPYLRVFWLTIVLHHYLAVDFHLNWKLFHHARAVIESLQ